LHAFCFCLARRSPGHFLFYQLPLSSFIYRVVPHRSTCSLSLFLAYRDKFIFEPPSTWPRYRGTDWLIPSFPFLLIVTPFPALRLTVALPPPHRGNSRIRGPRIPAYPVCRRSIFLRIPFASLPPFFSAALFPRRRYLWYHFSHPHAPDQSHLLRQRGALSPDVRDSFTILLTDVARVVSFATLHIWALWETMFGEEASPFFQICRWLWAMP